MSSLYFSNVASAELRRVATDTFGVTIFFNNVGFSTELPRDSLAAIMADIENQLTENGAPDDSDRRIALVMLRVSDMVQKEIEHTDDAEIACALAYCLGKQAGFEMIENIRGFVGTYLLDKLLLGPCFDDLEFQTETELLKQVMMSQDVDEYVRLTTRSVS